MTANKKGQYPVSRVLQKIEDMSRRRLLLD